MKFSTKVVAMLGKAFKEGRIENRILRRLFGPKRDENGEWRRFHNEELHGLYRLPNIVRVVKSTRLSWAGEEFKQQNTLHEHENM